MVWEGSDVITNFQMKYLSLHIDELCQKLIVTSYKGGHKGCSTMVLFWECPMFQK
jgi:hypothetical protein